MATGTGYSLRLPASLMKEVKRAAEAEGTSINQFITVAVARRLAELKTLRYFEARAARADPDAFERLQARVRNRYPVTLSVGVGTAATPAAALDAAGAVLREAGSAQAGDRREVLGHRTADGVDDPGPVTVAHFDVVDATGTYTDSVSPARAEVDIRSAVLELAEHLRAEHDAVTQFVGGDNAIAVCPPLDRAAVDAVTDHVRETTGVDLQVGVGHGPTAHAAGDDAKHALEDCRATGARVRGPWGVADD